MKRRRITHDSVLSGRVYGRKRPSKIPHCYMNGMLENGVLDRVFISGWSWQQT